MAIVPLAKTTENIASALFSPESVMTSGEIYIQIELLLCIDLGDWRAERLRGPSSLSLSHSPCLSVFYLPHTKRSKPVIRRAGDKNQP